MDVCETIDEVLTLLEQRATPGSLKVVRELPASLEWEVDPQQFRQAMWNLCLNAVDAMPDGGELRVAATVVDGSLVVRIEDSGDGIGGNDVAHVFEPFFSTKPGGSGLGLALVHRILKDHGGEVEVESSPGGSTFTLRIPTHHG